MSRNYMAHRWVGKLSESIPNECPSPPVQRPHHQPHYDPWTNAISSIERYEWPDGIQVPAILVMLVAHIIVLSSIMTFTICQSVTLWYKFRKSSHESSMVLTRQRFLRHCDWLENPSTQFKNLNQIEFILSCLRIPTQLPIKANSVERSHHPNLWWSLE